MISVSAGKNPPEEVNVVIEIAANSEPVKYEIDKESGMLFVDRIFANSMFYPCSYGFIPNTLAEDGDPVDVLVMCRYKLEPCSVIATRPVGVLKMEDDGGRDAKIIGVPVDKVSKLYSDIKDIDDVSEVLKQEIQFFFERYKDTEKGKWTKVEGFFDVNEARKIITESIDRYKQWFCAYKQKNGTSVHSFVFAKCSESSFYIVFHSFFTFFYNNCNCT
jgi:inorganic pyrophosphatase